METVTLDNVFMLRYNVVSTGDTKKKQWESRVLNDYYSIVLVHIQMGPFLQIIPHLSSHLLTPIN